jgi:hypothetical protein
VASAFEAADRAILAAWRALRRHRPGEGSAPTRQQLSNLAAYEAPERFRDAWRRSGWPVRGF